MVKCQIQLPQPYPADVVGRCKSQQLQVCAVRLILIFHAIAKLPLEEVHFAGEECIHQPLQPPMLPTPLLYAAAALSVANVARLPVFLSSTAAAAVITTSSCPGNYLCCRPVRLCVI